MLRCFALQEHDLSQLQDPEYRDDTEPACVQWFDERAQALPRGFLSLWCWDPKEGWQHVKSAYRVTVNGPLRPATKGMAPPEPLTTYPGAESALEFAPDDFPLR